MTPGRALENSNFSSTFRFVQESVPRRPDSTLGGPRGPLGGPREPKSPWVWAPRVALGPMGPGPLFPLCGMGPIGPLRVYYPPPISTLIPLPE